MNKKYKTNWAENEHWMPENIVSPKNFQELQEVIKNAQKQGKNVKALGAGHSFSRCAATDGIQIDTENLNHVISFDPQTLTLETESGILLKDLYKFFTLHGVALPSIPNTDMITLGGAIANAAHGTNIHYGTIASFVTEIKLVIIQGEVLTIDKNHELFDAVLVNFGSLGIMYTATLQLVPEYDVVTRKYSVPFKEIKNSLQNIIQQNESTQFMLFPLQNITLIKTQNKIKKGMLSYKKMSPMANLIIEIMLYFFRPKKHRRFSILFQSFFNTKFCRSIFEYFYRSHSVGHWFSGEVTHHKSKFFNMEYALPLHSVNDALDRLFEITKKFQEQGTYTRTLPFILRPVGADERGWMSPTYKRETCYVDILFQVFDQNEIFYYQEVEKALLDFGARVSWSRKFFASGKEIIEAYPQSTDFYRAMKKLDPQGFFANDFLLKIFDSLTKS